MCFGYPCGADIPRGGSKTTALEMYSGKRYPCGADIPRGDSKSWLLGNVRKWYPWAEHILRGDWSGFSISLSWRRLPENRGHSRHRIRSHDNNKISFSVLLQFWTSSYLDFWIRRIPLTGPGDYNRKNPPPDKAAALQWAANHNI